MKPYVSKHALIQEMMIIKAQTLIPDQRQDDFYLKNEEEPPLVYIDTL